MTAKTPISSKPILLISFPLEGPISSLRPRSIRFDTASPYAQLATGLGSSLFVHLFCGVDVPTPDAGSKLGPVTGQSDRVP